VAVLSVDMFRDNGFPLLANVWCQGYSSDMNRFSLLVER
jgi:hypothetical protein